MVLTRQKGDKESRDNKEWKEGRLQTRRNSNPEEFNLRDVMREFQKINEKIDTYQKITQEQMLDLKKEIKEELGTIRQDVNDLQQDIKILKLEKIDSKKKQEILTKKLDTLETRNEKLQLRQEKLKEMEFQLRFHNVQEEFKEDTRQIIIGRIAKLLNCSKNPIKRLTEFTGS